MISDSSAPAAWLRRLFAGMTAAAVVASCGGPGISTGSGPATGGSVNIPIEIRTPGKQYPVRVWNPFAVPVAVAINGYPAGGLYPGRYSFVSLPEGEYVVTILDGYGRPLQEYQVTAGPSSEASHHKHATKEDGSD
jgi:hypothetical protein